MLEFTVAPSWCNNSRRNQADCITVSVFFTSEEKGQFKCHRKGGLISLREWSSCNSPRKAEGETSEIWRENTETKPPSVTPGFGSAQACSSKPILSLTWLLEEALAPILDYCCVRQVWKEVFQTDGEPKTPPKEMHPEGQHLNSLLILLAHPQTFIQEFWDIRYFFSNPINTSLLALFLSFRF